ncbi:hypothetical protein HRbin06_00248 [archaeon HR06]|nr:hypothetical protein HRbin06_00248 [archaeon HR06]
MDFISINDKPLSIILSKNTYSLKALLPSKVEVGKNFEIKVKIEPPLMGKLIILKIKEENEKLLLTDNNGESSLELSFSKSGFYNLKFIVAPDIYHKPTISEDYVISVDV